MATPLRNLDELSTDQQDKETPHNQALRKLEKALGDTLTVAMFDADQTPAEDDALHALFIECTGALTAGRNLVLPTRKAVWYVKNSTTGGFDITVKTAAGSGVRVSPGVETQVRCDGTNVVKAGNGRLAILGFGAGSSGTTQVSRWLYPWYEANTAGTVRVVMRAPCSGRVHSLFVECHNGAPAGGDITFTVEKESADQSLTCTVTDGQTQAEDTSNSFTVKKGERLSIETTFSVALTTQALRITATLVLEEE